MVFGSDAGSAILMSGGVGGGDGIGSGDDGIGSGGVRVLGSSLGGDFGSGGGVGDFFGSCGVCGSVSGSDEIISNWDNPRVSSGSSKGHCSSSGSSDSSEE